VAHPASCSVGIGSLWGVKQLASDSGHPPLQLVPWLKGTAVLLIPRGLF
jgi:hypothetical protein